MRNNENKKKNEQGEIIEVFEWLDWIILLIPIWGIALMVGIPFLIATIKGT
jgi:hypothetical protein